MSARTGSSICRRSNETRLVSDEVVLQMPCNVPQAVLDEIIKQHNLTTLASQCLQEGGNAAFRMRHASSETVSAVIRALAAHQVIAAAQANYVYTRRRRRCSRRRRSRAIPANTCPRSCACWRRIAWSRGNGIPIAVINSEIDAAHPDLTGTIANRYDATGVEDSPHAHGTGMAGAIVSHQKLLGIAPGARILAIRAFSTRAASPESTTYHILRGHRPRGRQQRPHHQYELRRTARSRRSSARSRPPTTRAWC